MSWYLYSPEEFPNSKMLGKAMYTPEYLIWGGITLSPIPAREWVEFPDAFFNLRKESWRDRNGSQVHISGRDMRNAITKKHADRGVIVLDHRPTDEERKEFESKSEKANLAFRMKAVEWYENQVREKEVTGFGRTTPTPYEHECYEVLGLTKPFSVEAMRAQRHPGEAVAEEIAAAINRLAERKEQEREKVTTRPKPPAGSQ